MWNYVYLFGKNYPIFMEITKQSLVISKLNKKEVGSVGPKKKGGGDKKTKIHTLEDHKHTQRSFTFCIITLK